MLARMVPRLVRTARAPVLGVRLRMHLPYAFPYARLITTSPPLYKKKNKAEKTPEPPADADGELDLDGLNETMNKTVARCAETVRAHIGSLGRVDACTWHTHAALLDSVRVSCGKDAKATPLHDYATVGVRDNLLVITAYDESTLKHIERAIYAAKLDLAPRVAPEEGEGVILVPVPKPTGETRQLLVQKCTHACDQAKQVLRNARQTAQKQLKHDLDNKVVSKTVFQKEQKKLEEVMKRHTTQIERLAADAHKRLVQ